MDVTSLLNATATVARLSEQSQGERLATPPLEDNPAIPESVDTTPSPRSMVPRRPSAVAAVHGSRIPWDAGGYSLALALESRSSSLAGKSGLPADSPGESGSPRSPWHKLSESHSSRSSHASSSSFWSQPHSRFSSISTVNGLPTIPDVSTLEIEAKPYFQETSYLRLKDARPVPLLDLPPRTTPVSQENPLSPSDAVMHIRSNSNADAVHHRSSEASQDIDGRSTSRHLLQVEGIAKHKRTISAPDFAQIEVKGVPNTSLASTQSCTPPSESSETTPTDSADYMHSIAGAGRQVASQPLEEQIKCMYVDNCDTNSSLRKAISHIFGRNKLCTRMIPAHVWVHYCRKHYQRSRYRNAQEYAKLQAELVQRQVMRIQVWSDANKALGQGSVVVSWSVSMRKREQNRVQEKSKKRSLTGDSEEDDDCADRAVANGTAVPEWLRGKCGEGYSTAEIEAITSRLKENVDSGALAQIPDIEILPNISADPAEDARSRGVSKRRPGTIVTHRRAQSVSVRACPPINTPSDKPGVHAIPFIRTEEIGDMFPAPKRHRGGPISYNGYTSSPHDAVSPARPQYSNPHTPSSYGLPHRPAMAHGFVGEEYLASPCIDSQGGRPISQPPQRPALAIHQAGPVFAHSLSSPRGLDKLRRLSHGRSHSEVSSMSHHHHGNEFTFRSPPPTTNAHPYSERYHAPPSSAYSTNPFTSEMAAHLSPSVAYHRQAPRNTLEHAYMGAHRSATWAQQTHGAELVSDPTLLSVHRHTRNLSTPVAFRDSPPAYHHQHFRSYAPERAAAVAGGSYTQHQHQLYHHRV